MKKTFVLAALIAGAVEIHAQQYQTSQTNYQPDADNGRSTAFQLSLTPDIALHPRDTTVRGVSLNIWGENPQHGFAFGFVNGSTGESSGFSWGIVNYDDTYHGVQWGMVNVSYHEFVGWQPGMVNFDQGTFTGFQSGIVNITDQARGFQLGFVNYARQMSGLQIGLVNVIADNPWFSEFPDKLATGFPLVNWSF
jgi:hypothetical protein